MLLNTLNAAQADLAFWEAHKDDEDFWESHPDGKLTMSEDDEELRREWMRLYKHASKAQDKPSDQPVGCTIVTCPASKSEENQNNWIILKYLYPDRDWRRQRGVPNAQFLVCRAGGGEIARGILDRRGYKRIDGLPLDVTSVTITYFSDPEPYQVFEVFQPQPHNLPRPAPDYLETARTVIETYLDWKLREAKWVWGAVEGDFNKNPDLGQILLSTVISLIPIADQVSDIRDIASGLIDIYETDDLRDFWLWFGLVLTIVGCIPEIGSAIKGVFNIAVEVLKEGGKKVNIRKLIDMLNSIGEGNAARWLRELREDLLTKHFPWVLKKLNGILSNVLARIRTIYNWVSGEARERLNHVFARVTQIRDAARDMVKAVMDRVHKWLDELLGESKHVDTSGSTKQTNPHQQQQQQFHPAVKKKAVRVDKPGNRPDKFLSYKTKHDVPEHYRNDPRFDNLSNDPAHTGDPRAVVNGRREAMAGLEAEDQGLIKRPIERGPTRIEFYDGDGKPWDVKTPPSPAPGQKWNLDTVDAGTTILKKLDIKYPNKNTGQPEAVNVILDSSYMNEADHKALWDYLNKKATPDQLTRIQEINTRF